MQDRKLCTVTTTQDDFLGRSIETSEQIAIWSRTCLIKRESSFLNQFQRSGCRLLQHFFPIAQIVIFTERSFEQCSAGFQCQSRPFVHFIRSLRLGQHVYSTIQIFHNLLHHIFTRITGFIQQFFIFRSDYFVVIRHIAVTLYFREIEVSTHKV